jgi:hypothetical protein
MAKSQTLQEYRNAQGLTHNKGRLCAICGLDPDLRSQINDTLREGERTIIIDWARENHPDLSITFGSLDHHKRSGHHLED